MKTLKEYYEWLRENQMTFSIDELQTKKTLKEINSYLYFNAEFLGQGQQRTVYAIDAQKIIKVAIKPQDAEQNYNEVKNAKCLGQRYAPMIYENDRKNFFWIIQERLKPVTPEQLLHTFQTLTQHRFPTWEVLRNYIYYSVSGETIGDSSPEEFQSLFVLMYQQNEWFKGLINGLRQCQITSSDFHDENWGIRPETGELVILDLGF